MPVLSIWCHTRKVALFAVLDAAIALVTGGGAALASGSPDSARTVTAVNAATTNSGIAPVMTCSQVASLDLAAAVPDVPFEITSAAEVAAADNTLGKWAYCNVQGVIAPQIHFQLRLPQTGWQADYLQLGCSGLCGNVSTGNAAASTAGSR
jgi:hypothetical protein